MSTQLLPGLYFFRDSCNVYLVVGKKSSIAIDFGTGDWLSEFESLALPPISDVFLTHHHVDQCSGLGARDDWPFTIHASPGEAPFLSPDGVTHFWAHRSEGGLPASFSVLEKGIPDIQYDMVGWTELFWERDRIRFLETPGHSRWATSILVNRGAKQVLFCGDAAHAGATIHQPYHLEWDHWQSVGPRVAWEGIERLRGPKAHLLCPSHGDVIDTKIPALLRTLSSRLMKLVEAKGSICAGQPDRYVRPRFAKCGAAIVASGLYQFGSNSYLLHSSSGEALVIDPYIPNLNELPDLLAEIGCDSIPVATATHYHVDHSNGLPVMKERYGTRIVLHPWVAAPLHTIGAIDAPWLTVDAIRPDELMPESGRWTWNEFEFEVAPLPGQTWWHAGFMTTIGGKKILFSGDSFQPASRWNGTGGFSSFNGSRFQEGFVRSAKQIMDWAPDIIAGGHQTYWTYTPGYFHAVLRWAEAAEQAVKDLCPSRDLEADYYLHRP